MDHNVTDSLVLIVDDNPQNLQVMGNLLKENGYIYIKDFFKVLLYTSR